MSYSPASPVSVEAFLPFVLPHVPGCPVVAAKQAIVSAAIEFCERSRVWQTVPSTSTLDVVANQSAYAVPVPAEGNSAMVLELWLDGRLLTPLSHQDLQGRFGVNWLTVTGSPIHYTQFDQDAVILVPKPVAGLTGGLLLRACFKPARTAATLPAILFNQYVEGVAAGAVLRLLLTPGKPWTQPELAGPNAEQYNAEINRAMADSAHGFVRSRLRNRPAFF